MRALRSIAIVFLVSIGLLAASGAVLWSASLAGLARTEVVATGAMAPRFAAGDLVIITPQPTSELRTGDVVSVRSPGASAGHLERVLSVTPTADGWTMDTAARVGASASEHTVGTESWTPSARVPVVGGLLEAMVEPAYAIPSLALLLLLAAVVLVGRAPALPARRIA